jgi:hypothetical protein
MGCVKGDVCFSPILLKNRSHLVAARDSLAGKRCSGG